MAWYAELKRRHWYRIIGIDMVTWYSNKLYDEWWNSLTDEQRERILERRRLRKERREQEARDAIARLGLMTAMVAGLYNRTPSRADKYHGVYDEDGFPII